MPCMDILDNIVWLYNVGKGLKWFEQSSRDLEIMFEIYYQKIYGHLDIQASMWDYYQSWLLRGDNPQLYFSQIEKAIIDIHRVGVHIIPIQMLLL